MMQSNVDRLFAIWEALNPISVIGEQDLNDPRALNQNTPLKPFWDNKTQDYWTFARLTDTRKLGYAYPETQSWLYAFNIPRYHTFIVGELYIQYGNVFVDFVANNLANRREEHEKDMAKLSKKLASGKPDEDQSGVAADKGAAEEKPPFGVDTRGIIAAPGGEKPLKPVGVPKLDDEMQDGKLSFFFPPYFFKLLQADKFKVALFPFPSAILHPTIPTPNGWSTCGQSNMAWVSPSTRRYSLVIMMPRTRRAGTWSSTSLDAWMCWSEILTNAPSARPTPKTGWWCAVSSR